MGVNEAGQRGGAAEIDGPRAGRRPPGVFETADEGDPVADHRHGLRPSGADARVDRPATDDHRRAVA